ncbi:MAG: CdaR family protein [Anaerolineae bacterium]
MNGKLWRVLLSNLSSVFLALFLGMVVWVVAVYEKAPPRTDFFPHAIPIKIINLRQGLTLTGPVATAVRVKIRALASTWDKLQQESFEATVDLHDLEAGQHEVPVVVQTLEKGVVILAVEPSRITVNLQEMDTRKVRVKARVLDEESVPLGYTPRLPEVTPEQVTITGPKNLVAQVAEATIEISLKNARETILKQEAPLLLDGMGNRVLGVSVSPATVTVKVVIERQVGYRDVTVRARTKGSPAPGYWISNIRVEPALVTVYGQPTAIEDLPGYLDTQPIDVEGAKQDVVQRIALDLPEGILVLGAGAGKEGILVQISIQPLMGGQTIHSELILQNLRIGLKATASPTAVDIILSGPLPALQELKPEDLQVVLDLFGLSKGTHKVTPKVILPEGLGLEVKSIVPDIVEVTIE